MKTEDMRRIWDTIPEARPLIQDLATCVELAGEDVNGDQAEPWRYAARAVEAVRELRSDYKELRSDYKEMLRKT